MHECDCVRCEGSVQEIKFESDGLIPWDKIIYSWTYDDPEEDSPHARWLADRKRAASGGLPPLQQQQLDAMMARRAAAALREQNANALKVAENHLSGYSPASSFYAEDYAFLTGSKDANAKRTRS